MPASRKWSHWLQEVSKRFNKPLPKTPLRVTGVYSDDLMLWVDPILRLLERVDVLDADGKIHPFPEPHLHDVQTHHGKTPRFLYLLCSNAAFTNIEKYLDIRAQQSIKFKR